MAGGGGGGEEMKLEFTPTWVVALVCSVIVSISLLTERLLHFLGKHLKRKNKKPLFEALQKVKEELMLMGFISLLLAVFQGVIEKQCIPRSWTRHMLPCKKDTSASAASSSQFQSAYFSGVLGGARRLLVASGSGSDKCAKEKVPLLSIGALHDLHIFIFVLAVTHVLLSALTMVLGGIRMRQWKHWEDLIQAEKESSDDADAPKVTHVSQNEFIRNRFKGFGKDSAILSWLHSFVKQFLRAIDREDYKTIRLGFIMAHCRGNPKFNFHKYMVRSLQADFKKVVGLRWYLWFLVIILLLSNINGWKTYFWISFIPLLLLLVVGAKLEHIITQLAHEVAEKHSAIEGDLVVKPSDDHFWFRRPWIVLHLIHFILFQIAFEIAVFFFVLTRYDFHSCIMGRAGYAITRLVIGGIIQLLCSYSTLPLYAIVTQMGSSFKKEIFDEHVQEGLVVWAQKIKKKNKGKKVVNKENNSSHVGSGKGSTTGIQMQNMVVQREALMEEGNIEIGEANRTE